MTGGRYRFSQKQMIDALVKAQGLKGPAARALNCDRRTVSRYIKQFPAIKEAHEEAIQATIDLAQAKLVELVEVGDWRAIRFLLCTLGKDRGFTERQEIVAVGDDAEALRRQIEEDILRVYGDDQDDDRDDE